MERKQGFFSALKEAVVRGLSPARSREKSPARSASPMSGLMRRRRRHHVAEQLMVARSGEALGPQKPKKEPTEDEKRRMKIVAGSLMKAVIRPGGGDSTPSDRDQVIYHCTVRTVDEVIVESSRSEYGGKGIPIRSVLGKSKMLVGLLEGIPTMHMGEIAMLKMKPQVHYGEDDCPLSAPRDFPKDDELHFEIEMIDFFKAKVQVPGPPSLTRRKPTSSSSTEPGRVVGRRVTIPSRASEPQFPFWQQTWFIALLLAMAVGFPCLAVFLFLGLDLDTGYAASSSTPKAEGVETTYGTVLKLMHEKTKFRLHSHDVPYDSGSGQQSVTGFPNVDDANSYWVVGPQLETSARQGDSIPSGTIIRLQHMKTRKWLHSHLHASPISSNQEISCFGGENESDTGDHWRLLHF